MFVAELFEDKVKKTVVIMPGGFHPFHTGHMSLYNAAVKAFPGADVYVAATNDTSARPLPFDTKAKLAEFAGVPAGHFVQVKSPFQAKEITQNYDPSTTALVFVRSEKDRDQPPQAGTIKKDGSPSYLQPISKDLAPMSQHGYMAYLPTIEFKAGNSGITSASEIRAMWPAASEEQRVGLVRDLYPRIAKNPQIVMQVVQLLDTALAESIEEHIGKVKGGYRLYSKHGSKNLGTFPTKAGAEKHEREVQYFKHANESVAEASFDREAFRQQMRDLEAREELRKTDPVAAKALDLRGQLPQQSKKKPDDSSMSINDPRHPGFAYTELGHHKVDEGDVVQFPKKHRGDISDMHTCPKCGGDTQGGKYMGHQVQVCMPCKQVYLPPNSGIDKQGNPIKEASLNEFAPDEGGGARKFIPWTEFVEQLKQILHKDFSCKENIVKSTIKARFVPHDPMEFGPTMLYSYYETRAGGRNKGAISTRGAIQIGKYTLGGLFGQPKDQLLTSFNLLKGHPFERHFDLTFDNIYKIANIIQGNTQGAYQMPQQQGVSEGSTPNKGDEVYYRNRLLGWFVGYGNNDKVIVEPNEDEGHDSNNPIYIDKSAVTIKPKQQGVAEGSEQQWVVTVGTKTGGTSHTMTFSGTKEQAIKKAVARFGTSKNPVVTAKPKQQGVAEGDSPRTMGLDASLDQHYQDKKHLLTPGVARPGQLVTIIKAPRMLDLLPGETFEVRTSDADGVTLKHGLGTRYDNVKFPHGTYKIAKAQGVREGKEHKIKQLKKDYATAVHWSKNDTNSFKRESARLKAEKIKRHLETQYKQSVDEDASGVIATKAQANDPRYSMSLTKDVRPGQVEKNLKAFKLNGKR
jgi:hypothetical protein